jgi:hypothetical protein
LVISIPIHILERQSLMYYNKWTKWVMVLAIVYYWKPLLRLTFEFTHFFGFIFFNLKIFLWSWCALDWFLDVLALTGSCLLPCRAGMALGVINPSQ